MDDLPESQLEQIVMLESILVAQATGGPASNAAYMALRRELMSDDQIKPLLPAFVRTYRSLDAFWPYIRDEASNYAKRRQLISAAFTPAVEYLEGANRMPGDAVVSGALTSIDAEGVQAVWTKALARRTNDPEGAITVARTLLETVCKTILDDVGPAYADKDDLPKLYRAVADTLRLAPDQHTEEPIKMILGGAMQLVNGIGTLRNRLSDAHGRGGKLPVKPSPRHASLAVNTAGAVATFLVETYRNRRN